MSINITDLKKKIIYRSTYRGTKQMDSLLVSFTKKYIDELTVFQDNNQLNEVHRNILNYANVDNSQVIIENLHNYQSYTRIPESVTMTNHSGAEVLRIKKSYANEIGPGNLQFRGSYGDWKITQLMSRKKTARKEVIIGRQMVDRAGFYAGCDRCGPHALLGNLKICKGRNSWIS